MKKNIFLILFLLACITAFPQTYSATDSVVVSSTNYSVRNWGRGFDFVPNVDIYVTNIGKRVPSDNGTYVWKIWETDTQTLVYTQTSSSTTANIYTYEPLSTPVTLTAGQPYTLTLYCDDAGYYFGSSSQINEHLTFGIMRYCNDCYSTQPFPTILYGSYHYGTPDFLFTLDPPASEVPVSNWAIIIGLLLIGTFIVIRFRR